ncbi:PPOX class F420-dependent oxidoreductase [Candidatus Chloroploca sp. M-50]|uniref:PPOX class F420-dependent oxidoreductase n=1 Tax=Candidatus Chloroploca mongolica TaxID=2528176 RepID=A0ABS4DEN1_9CHLR|nr:PPOX class F420-dependent oxidoreductase [Candidatus Chloroploca mongolica]MBP1467892.1 PPOX class F420-dependent oxidoreductase [Candidatus Chloroploca mongolica]
MTESTAFAYLQDHKYINLTTYRKSGEGVPTPVWFALQGERMYIVTEDNSGKVKRIRNNGKVGLAPSDARGKVLGEAASGMARVLSFEEGTVGHQVLQQKYGLMYRAFGFFWNIRRITPVILEVVPA